MAAVFTCTRCNAVPDQVVDGKAQLAIVRHKLGCPTLLAQVRTRWADEPVGLPETPAPAPFGRLGANNR